MMSKRSRDEFESSPNMFHQHNDKYIHVVNDPQWGQSNKRIKLDSEINEITNHGFHDNHSVTFAGNKIYFNGVVNTSSVNKLIQIIEHKNKEFGMLSGIETITGVQPKPIILFINSPGGHLFQGFAAVDAIRDSVVPIYTVIRGYACSAATLMSVVGKKRFMTRNAAMLIHELSSGVIGKFSSIKDEYENGSLLMQMIRNIYKECTKISNRKLNELLARDIYLDLDQCISLGMVDEEWQENKPVDPVELLKSLGFEIVNPENSGKNKTSTEKSQDDTKRKAPPTE